VHVHTGNEYICTSAEKTKISEIAVQNRKESWQTETQ